MADDALARPAESSSDPFGLVGPPVAVEGFEQESESQRTFASIFMGEADTTVPGRSPIIDPTDEHLAIDLSDPALVSTEEEADVTWSPETWAEGTSSSSAAVADLADENGAFTEHGLGTFAIPEGHRPGDTAEEPIVRLDDDSQETAATNADDDGLSPGWL